MITTGSVITFSLFLMNYLHILNARVTQIDVVFAFYML